MRNYTDNDLILIPPPKGGTRAIRIGDLVFPVQTYQESSEGTDIILGVVDYSGKFQALKFNGTAPSNSGQPQTISEVWTYNTGYPDPQYAEGEDLTAYVVGADGSVLYAQKLRFNGTIASDSGQPQILSNVKIFNTGHPQPQQDTQGDSIAIQGASDNSLNGIYVQVPQMSYEGKPVYILE